ncbi:hypothetical protein HAX54_038541 [Datura stramonium]|uniref:Uncharacterized protein n=1 Tax=Datura stramonium TaxID=4076 RepID=A0ABS8VKP2_DATST|nr:hypothetical protein [Datura stramonium]
MERPLLCMDGGGNFLTLDRLGSILPDPIRRDAEPTEGLLVCVADPIANFFPDFNLLKFSQVCVAKLNMPLLLRIVELNA